MRSRTRAEEILIEGLQEHANEMWRHLVEVRAIISQLMGMDDKNPLNAPEIIGADTEGDGGKVFDD